MPDKHYVGLDLTGFEDNGKTRPISRITLNVDDNNVITAGDDTGLELVADCPHATQAMADAILKRMKGYQYQMFSADAANIDPAAELGDGVTAGGVYGVISRLSDDGQGYPSITAPGEAELEDEYPTGGGPMTKAFNRQLAQTRSLITKSAEEIKLSIEATDGRVSELKVTLDGVTITDGSGTTRIKGSSIDTGSIAAGSIRADQINMTGAISWGDLTGEVQDEISDRGISESRAQTLITSTLVSSPNIAGGTFYNLEQQAYIKMTSQNTGRNASSGLGYFSKRYSDYTPVFEVYHFFGVQAGNEGTMIIRAFGNEILSYFGDERYVQVTGEWNFSAATVTGLTAVFG